jgi:hypothetical protein
MAKRIGDDLEVLIQGFRGKIKRSQDRAEPLVISPNLLSSFLDKVEERIHPSNSGLRGGESK